MKDRLRCAVVEGGLEARRSLVDALRRIPGVEIVGAAGDVTSAVQVIDATRPDLVFLEVRPPDIDGFAVLRRARHRPAFVVATANAAHAVAAFEFGALDYLVKPFAAERLEMAVNRARTRIASGDADPTSSKFGERPLGSRRPVRHLFARSRGCIIPVNVDDVIRICANGDYSEVFTERSSYLIVNTLAELVDCLDPMDFERVNRSHIVSLRSVRNLRAAGDRRLLVVLKDGTTVLASRSASARLRRRARNPGRVVGCVTGS